MRLRLWFAILLSLPAPEVRAQYTPLLRLDPADSYGGPLSIDRGVAGLRQRLMELRTTASVMQVTAHPDDEQAGLLTYFSRGTGARTALLSINRGEAGANAVGPELFDALGLLRAQELTLSAKYYGLDDLYFTNAVDYGYSKTLAEAARSFDTAAVLREMVEIIRWNRPLVVISRWYGGARDGHGQHQLAGALVPLAVAAAADSSRYADQLVALRPWRVKRLFRSNLPPDERTDVTIDAGRFDPWLGQSYQSFGATGLALQRSQTAGRRGAVDGLAPQRLQLIAGMATSSAADPFAGMDTSLPGLFAVSGEQEPPGARALLTVVDDAARRALESFDPESLQASVPHLARGLSALRTLSDLARNVAPNSRELIEVKTKQFERAIATAIGLDVQVIASAPAGGRAVPGDAVKLEISLRHEATGRVSIAQAFAFAEPTGGPGPDQTPIDAPAHATTRLTRSAEVRRAPASIVRPPFHRAGVEQNHYDAEPGSVVRYRDTYPVVGARVALMVGDALLFTWRTARYARSEEPNGVTYPAVTVVSPVSLHPEPAVRVVTGAGARRVRITVDVTGNGSTPVDAAVYLAVADKPVTMPVSVRVQAGSSQRVPFDVTLPASADSMTVTAFARVDTLPWSDDITTIAHRDLEPTRLYSQATARIRRIPVTLGAGLRVGYVMGVGDLVPDAIAQLGATVTLLDSTQVASGNFRGFDTIVIGTRAYAVRPDLVTATPALLTWARAGGNVVVLYQTQEFKPETMAPFRARLPGNAEEVTEQDAPVVLLAANDPLLAGPNRISARDFDGWIEQRGSKFLTELAPEYTALVETHDTGQVPQRGIWVTAPVGRGRWTYVALALHRQVPYAVPGAYRILANLLSPLSSGQASERERRSGTERR